MPVQSPFLLLLIRVRAFNGSNALYGVAENLKAAEFIYG